MMRWMDAHQVALYLAAIGAGAAVGLLAPVAARPLEYAITPALALVLTATFIGVPFAAVTKALADMRFLAVVLVVDFVALPLVVFGLSRLVADDAALLLGVLLVLLTPCVDYVIVFTGLAGGARERLLAATPLLMIAQILLLPLYLWSMAGPGVVGVVEVAPFVEAFVVLIVIPLLIAVTVQAAARRWWWAERVKVCAERAMVTLMMVTLAVVVGSQVAAVSGAIGALLAVVPIFAAFVVIAAVVGALCARAARLGVAERRAVVFSGVTRNSLVVLPLALALPVEFALAPLVVVTQTLVELVAMAVMVAVVPRLVR